MTATARASYVEILHSTLGVVSPQLVHGPVDGTLEVLSDRYRYHFDDHFRSLGHDRFLVVDSQSVTNPTTVQIVLAEERTELINEEFELLTEVGIEFPGSESAIISAAAGLQGQHGLEIQASSPPGSWLRIWDVDDPGDEGGAAAVGEAWDDPVTHQLFDVLRLNDLATPQQPLRVRLIRPPGSPISYLRLLMWDQATAQYLKSAKLPLPSHAFQLEVDWWLGSSAGATLWIDDLATSVSGARLENVEIDFADLGLMPVGVQPTSGFYFDAVRVYREGSLRSDRLRASDDFARNTLEGWADRSMNFSAAQVNDELVLGAGASFWLASTFEPTPRLGTRLRIDPTFARTGSADFFGLGHSGDPLSAASDVTLRLRRDETTGLFCIDVLAYDSAAPRIESVCGLSASPHEVALQWLQSLDASSRTGSVRLWVDGEPVVTMKGLDTDDQAARWVRFGSDNSTFDGSFALDDVATWN